MRAIVAEAIEAGAVGFATSKSPTHVGFEGRPVPSRSAELAEILALTGALGDAGRGVIQATMGSGLAFAEFAEITRRCGRPISWTALLAGVGGPGVSAWMLEESIKLLDQGLLVHPQVSCRPLNFEFTMAEPFPFESMRLFGAISAAPDLATKVGVYRDTAFRSELRQKLAAGKGGVLGRQLGAHRGLVVPARSRARRAQRGRVGRRAWGGSHRPGARPGPRVRSRGPLPDGRAQLRRGRGRGPAHRPPHHDRPVRRRRPCQPAVRLGLLHPPPVTMGPRAQAPCRSPRRCAS